MSRRNQRRPTLVTVLVVVLIIIAVQYFARHEEDPARPAGDGPAGAGYRVDRVVDGDTMVVSPMERQAGNSDDEFSDDASSDDDLPSAGGRLRLLGIDTPETVKADHPVEPWGMEAKEFARDFVAGGVVQLQFDEQRRDQYGRFLAYVYVGDWMLNEELVRAGLAEAKFYRGDAARYGDVLDAAEREARQAGRGIWSGQPPE